MKNYKRKIFSIALTLLMLTVVLVQPVSAAKASEKNTNYPFILVDGLFAWSTDDGLSKVFPYWGMTTGDLIKRLNKQGFDCYQASMGPISSAWDRACELYAQLVGGTVDYGVAHSKAHNHERFGRTYSEPLIKKWDSENKINLLGYSFGGNTSRLFIQLLAEGSEEERAATPANELSGLFTGGKADYIYSLTTFTSPHNGTTFLYAFKGLLDVFKQIVFILADASEYVEAQKIYDFQLEQFGITPKPGDTTKSFDIFNAIAVAKSEDNIFYDLSLEGAQKLNDVIEIQEGIYYFSYAGSKTSMDVTTGDYVTETGINPALKPFANGMGKYRENTVNDIPIDERWLSNDGAVNTFSALHPFDEPYEVYDMDTEIESGVWYVMPVQNIDHLAFVGGVFNMGIKEITNLYANQFNLVCGL